MERARGERRSASIAVVIFHLEYMTSDIHCQVLDPEPLNGVSSHPIDRDVTWPPGARAGGGSRREEGGPARAMPTPRRGATELEKTG